MPSFDVFTDGLRKFLEKEADSGHGVDAGYGMGRTDYWVTIDGIEYFIEVKKSNAQLKKEGMPPHA